MLNLRVDNSVLINKPQSAQIKAQRYNATIPANSKDQFINNKTKNKSSIRQEFETVKGQQGAIGKLWDGFKNLFRMKSGSKNVEQIIKQAEAGKISTEEAQEAIEKYKEGQKTCVDVVADMASGILAVGSFALAVPTGGASLAAGLAIATATGTAVKVGIKASDAVVTGKGYASKDLLYDCATGAINGIMAPVTNGLGNCVTKTLGKKLGLKVIEEGAQQAAKEVVKQTATQGIKSAIINQSVDVAGGTIFKRAIALGTGMAVDGALSGASDNMVRAALNGDDVIEAGVQGAVGGMIMAPVIGGSFRLAAKAGKAINNKITTKILLPDGIDTKFKQGSIGDCALLSTIDGMMNNPDASKLIKNSITKSAFGDYNVKIGDTTVRVAKSALTDEMLSDTTGIKIFEQAYKQLAGDIDGGFAEVVAKQFGLNPIHIANDTISDELLDQIAKEQRNTVLSFGALVDSEGAISSTGSQRHYFTIKNIDSDNKIVRLTSPLDTSKAIDLSYDDVKRFGISIDGGSIKESKLPTKTRPVNDITFKGISIQDTKAKFLKQLGISESDFTRIYSEAKLSGYSLDEIAARLEFYNIEPSNFAKFIQKIADDFGASLSDSDELAIVMTDVLKTLEIYPIAKSNPILGTFSFSLEETYNLYQAINHNSSEEIYAILRNNNPVIAKAIQDARTKTGQDIITGNLSTFYEQFVENPMLDSISAENILDIGLVNGRSKKIIFPDATTIPSARTSVVPQDLIKSNMMTYDLIQICTDKNIPLPDTCKMNLKAPNADKIKVPVKTQDLIDRVRAAQSLDCLSSNEIHALTDMFSELYENKSTKLADAVASYIKNPQNSKRFSQIYDCIEYLKTQAASVLQDGKVEIEDHAFMRMLDRNMATVTDNKTPRIINFQEFISILKQNALKGNTEITGINGSDGIKMILRKNPKTGAVIIDSIM